MTQKRPQREAVKVDPVAIRLVRFDLKSLDDPHGDVTNDEERDQLATRFHFPQGHSITAPPQTVDDERCLQNDLQDLQSNKRKKQSPFINERKHGNYNFARGGPTITK